MFRTKYRLGIEKPRKLTEDNISHIVGRLCKVVKREKKGKTNRYDVAKNHGFRKFFAISIKNTDGITPTMSEKLINHIGVVQLDGSHYKTTKEQMFEAYKKAIQELTISDSERDRIKLEEKDKKISELEEKEKR